MLSKVGKKWDSSWKRCNQLKIFLKMGDRLLYCMLLTGLKRKSETDDIGKRTVQVMYLMGQEGWYSMHHWVDRESRQY